MRCKAGLFSRRIIAAATPPDPAFSSVVALLHFEGSEGDTSTNDSSSYSKSIGFTNSPSISTAQYRFGSSSLALSGATNQRITVNSSAVIGANDFTIEFFVRFAAVPTTTINFARWASGFEIRLSDSLYVARVSTTPFSLSTYSESAPWSPSLNVWYHVAVCRTANNMRLFVDGAQLGNAVDLGSAFSFPSGNQQFGSTSGLQNHSGHIDEIRVSLADVYSAYAPFTPPTAPFPNA
jgi:hypothetical protein